MQRFRFPHFDSSRIQGKSSNLTPRTVVVWWDTIELGYDDIGCPVLSRQPCVLIVNSEVKGRCLRWKGKEIMLKLERNGRRVDIVMMGLYLGSEKG
jgi:hypothetical protein